LDEAGGGYFGNAATPGRRPYERDYDGAEPAANSISAQLALARMLHDETSRRANDFGISSSSARAAVPQLLVAPTLALSPPAQAVVAGTRTSTEVQA
jgi:hypothetical protein